MKPLSPARYKIRFTADQEFVDMLEDLRPLMRSSVPDGDMVAILKQAMAEKLQRLKARRFGATEKPRKSLEASDTKPDSRGIPAAVKRAVCERDRNQCTFRDERGRRCMERRGLEFHHKVPFRQGGDHSIDNIFLMCKTHNLHQAERDYGKEVMEQYRRQGDLIYEIPAEYRTIPKFIRASDGSAIMSFHATMSGTPRAFLNMEFVKNRLIKLYRLIGRAEKHEMSRNGTGHTASCAPDEGECQCTEQEYLHHEAFLPPHDLTRLSSARTEPTSRAASLQEDLSPVR